MRIVATECWYCAAIANTPSANAAYGAADYVALSVRAFKRRLHMWLVTANPSHENLAKRCHRRHRLLEPDDTAEGTTKRSNGSLIGLLLHSWCSNDRKQYWPSTACCLVLVFWLFVCPALSVTDGGIVSTSRAQSASAPGAAIPSAASEAVELVELSVVEVSPATPVAGGVVTISYRLRSSIALRKALTGEVDGSFQGQPLVTTSGQVVPTTVLNTGAVVNGQLQIKSPAAGPGTLRVTFHGPLLCSPPSANMPPLCRQATYASTSTSLTIAVPTVHVRIAGISYAHISKPDSGDSSSANGAFQCVVHDPGCNGSLIFTSGNNGTDTFFEDKKLPATAVLERTDFTPYWPNGIDASQAGGTLFGTGSYGTSENDSGGSDGISVKWNNACYGPFSGQRLYSSISFQVSMPQGTDLGEPTFDDSPQTSPCVPSAFSANPGSGTPTPSSTAFYLVQQGTWFGATFGAGASGKIQSITNGEDFEISLIRDGNMPGGCTGQGNVVLPPHAATSAAQLTGLYGSQSMYPKAIGACALSDITQTRQSIEVVVTSVPVR